MLLRSGLYSWINVFDGEIKHPSELQPSDYSSYDIIHINLSSQDVHLVGDVRSFLGKDSKTKIVANIDYTVELWRNSISYPSTFLREIGHADMIFGTEPNMVSALTVMLGRKVYLIPHPCFTDYLSKLGDIPKKDVVSIVSHRYDNNNIIPSYITKDMNIHTRLIGYDENSDTQSHITKTLYNSIYPELNYMSFCNLLKESMVVIDPFTLTSQSRVGWDCAAMGVPMIGSDRNYSVLMCYPFTSCGPYDLVTQRELLIRLMQDTEFRERVVYTAKKNVAMVSYNNSKINFLKALEDAQYI
jgi:hypothetical protein